MEPGGGCATRLTRSIDRRSTTEGKNRDGSPPGSDPHEQYSTDTLPDRIKAVYENHSNCYLSDNVGALTTGGGKPGQGYPAILMSAGFIHGTGTEAGIGYHIEQIPTLMANAERAVLTMTYDRTTEPGDANGE